MADPSTGGRGAETRSDRWELPLSTDLDEVNSTLYFTWDDPMSFASLRHRLGAASPPERIRLLGMILREARDVDVWRFTSPEEVARNWPKLARHLGRRRPFWEYLLARWQRQGLVKLDAAQ